MKGAPELFIDTMRIVRQIECLDVDVVNLQFAHVLEGLAPCDHLDLDVDHEVSESRGGRVAEAVLDADDVKGVLQFLDDRHDLHLAGAHHLGACAWLCVAVSGREWL